MLRTHFEAFVPLEPSVTLPTNPEIFHRFFSTRWKLFGPDPQLLLEKYILKESEGKRVFFVKRRGSYNSFDLTSFRFQR